MKKKDDDDEPKGPGSGSVGKQKEVKARLTDLEGGWILGYTIHPGNEYDSRMFPYIYENESKLE